MARGLVPRGDLGFCHYERSEVIQKQVLLVRRLPRRVFYTSRNDKNRTTRFAMTRGFVPRGDLGFCHYERSEVIQKQVLLVSRLPRRVFYTSRNDKNRAACFAMTKSVRQVRGQEVRASRGQVTGKNCVASVLGMESPLGFGLATCREAERTSAGTFTSKEKLLAIYCSFAIRLAD